MRKKLSILIVALVASMSIQSAMAWSSWGHHISAYIAEKHLTPEAKAQCEHYLKHKLPHHSSWQDHWRHSDPFKESSYWHSSYVNTKYEVVGYKEDETRDAAYQVDRIVKEMNNGQYKNMSDSLVAVNLKFLIHLVGDMHCPSHVVHTKDFGLRGHSIYMKGKKVPRHSFWDRAPMYMHPKWNADHFVKAYDTYTAKEIKKICKGNAFKWSAQNGRNIIKTYGYWEKGTEFKELSKEQRKQIEETLHEQLAFAGYRLAAVLNKIFSK
jgi:hypothetical protein